MQVSPSSMGDSVAICHHRDLEGYVGKTAAAVPRQSHRSRIPPLVVERPASEPRSPRQYRVAAGAREDMLGCSALGWQDVRPYVPKGVSTSAQ
jgi:hypothetical protein